VSDKLCECDYCGGLRVFEKPYKCEGCGAPLTRGMRGEKAKLAPGKHIRLTQDQMGMMNQGQMHMNQMFGQMGMAQSSNYAQQLGMQQIDNELMSMFGMSGYQRERGRKK